MYHHLMTVFAMLFCTLANAQHTGNAPYCHERGGVLINEVSNGPMGFGNVKEYIELVVVGASNNPTAPVNIQGWILDDNNYPSGGQGNQQGHLVFGDCYTAIPPGSIIIVFNASDPNESLPPADPEDTNGDGVYVIPHEHPCVDACNSNPSVNDANYCPCSSQSGQLEGWLFGLRNEGDVAQVRDACETLVHALHWNGVKLVAEIEKTPVHHSIGEDNQSNKLFHFANLVSNDWNDPANYENVEIEGRETPGLPNNPANAAFIEQLKQGVRPCKGFIWDCRDTDAGDLVLPTNATSENAPIQLCQGDDLSAFQTSYEATDEFQPDALGFDYEYRYLLTTFEEPTYPILETSASGDFDFSRLDTGTYLVWGYSYIQTNGSISLDSFLNTPNGESIATIRTYIACGYHGDLDYNDPIGTPMEIRIISETIAAVPIDNPAICEGTTTFNLTQLDSLISGGKDWIVQWYEDSLGNRLLNNPSDFSFEQQGVYVTVRNVCTSNMLPVAFTIVPKPDFTLEIIEEISCADSTNGQLQVFWESMARPEIINWNDESLAGQLSVNDLPSGTYEVWITDEFGCSENASITLFPPDCEVVSEVMDSILQDSTILPPPNDTTAVDLDTTNTIPTDNPVINPPLPLSVELAIETNLYIPSAFSPNLDGLNDRFTIFATDKISSIKSLIIVDRWGNLVFEQTDFLPNQINEGWDGTFQGQSMDAAVFIFCAELVMEDGRVELAKGDFVLVK